MAMMPMMMMMMMMTMVDVVSARGFRWRGKSNSGAKRRRGENGSHQVTFLIDQL